MATPSEIVHNDAHFGQGEVSTMKAQNGNFSLHLKVFIVTTGYHKKFANDKIGDKINYENNLEKRILLNA